MKRKKKPSVSKLKKKLDILFSIFIRQRDQECFTCQKKMHWKKIQAGHFISRSKSATRYDEMNVHGQCPNCNIWRRGNSAEYAARLIKDYGMVRFNELIKKGRQIKQFTVPELQKLIEHYA